MKLSNSKIAGLLAAGLWVGCATMHDNGIAKMSTSSQVDPALLAGLSADQLSPVNDQQRAVDDATASLDQVKMEKEDASKSVRLAETDLDAAQADLKRVRAESDMAHKNYDAAQKPETKKSDAQAMGQGVRTPDTDKSLQAMGDADTQVRDAQGRVDAENMKLDYIKSLESFAGTKVKVAERQIDLEKAKLERARFEALRQARPDQVDAMKLNGAQFDATVAEKQADIAGSSADVAKARAEATSKYRTWISRGESLIEKGRERASVPPPPQG
jgi:hypothetical protein